MGNRKFIKTIKIVGFLLSVSLIILLMSAPASAATSSVNYQKGYMLGIKVGYKVGYNVGDKDCLEHGQNGVLTQIPVPSVNSKWTKSFTRGYKAGFRKGFIGGYHQARFKCLVNNRSENK